MLNFYEVFSIIRSGIVVYNQNENCVFRVQTHFAWSHHILSQRLSKIEKTIKFQKIILANFDNKAISILWFGWAMIIETDPHSFCYKFLTRHNACCNNHSIVRVHLAVFCSNLQYSPNSYRILFAFCCQHCLISKFVCI